jgi:Flp pilus assembly protein TadB
MALACLAGLGIFAGGLAAWHKGRGPRERKRVRKIAVEEEEHKEALAEQLA